MPKDYADITNSISSSVAKLSAESAELMQSFRAMSQAALKGGLIDEKTKEMIALSMGLAKQCDGCIGFHTKKLVKLGTTRAEFMELMNIFVYMGGGPGLMYAADALLAFEQFSATT